VKEKVGVGLKENEIKAERAEDKEAKKTYIAHWGSSLVHVGGEISCSSSTCISLESSLLFCQQQLDRMRNKGRREIERKLKRIAHLTRQ
jgi:hypothetical protein